MKKTKDQCKSSAKKQLFRKNSFLITAEENSDIQYDELDLSLDEEIYVNLGIS